MPFPPTPEQFVVVLDPSYTQAEILVSVSTIEKNYYMLGLIWLIMVEKHEHRTGQRPV